MTDHAIDRAAPRAGSLDRRSPAVLLGLALSFGLLAQYLFYRTGPGIDVLVATLALLVVAWAVRPSGARLDRADLWIAPTAVAFAVAIVVRTDAMLLLFDIPAVVTLITMAAVAFAGVPVTRRAADLVALLGVVVAGRILAGGAMLLAVFPELGRPFARRGGRAASVGIGLALAIPFLFVFAALFSSADAVFSSALRNVVDIQKWSIGDLFGRLVIGAFFAWAGGGLLTVAARGAEPAERSLLPRLRGHLSSVAATTALLAVDALFAFFVALQLAYLFGGRDTLEATGVSYSEYARRGFFELIAVAFIAGGLLFAVEIVVGRRSRLYVAAALSLVAATLIVVVSAAYRMQLYQLAYGWTEQRFYALAGIAWLGASGIVLGVLVARDATRWVLHGAALLALVVALGANAVGPAGFVARQNLERVIDPAGLPADAYRGLDVYYLASLGDGALPTTLEELPRLPIPWRTSLGAYLRDRVLEQRDLSAPAWQSWNVDRERARAALAEAEGWLRAFPPFCEVRGPCLPGR